LIESNRITRREIEKFRIFEDSFVIKGEFCKGWLHCTIEEKSEREEYSNENPFLKIGCEVECRNKSYDRDNSVVFLYFKSMNNRINFDEIDNGHNNNGRERCLRKMIHEWG